MKIILLYSCVVLYILPVFSVYSGSLKVWTVSAHGPWTVSKKSMKHSQEISTVSTLYWLNQRKHLLWKKLDLQAEKV